MRGWAAAAGCLVGGALFGCGGSTPPATLAVAPSGTVQVAGPTLFTATVQHSGSTVTWTLTGPGSLSATTGLEVVYQPPSPIGCTQTATLTAQIDRATATVQLTLCAGGMPAVKIPGLTAPVQVSYDAQDVPHVFCATAADCFAVQGYLQARDRLFPMDFLRHVARGRLAELIGALGLSQDVQLRTLLTTRDGKRIEDSLVAALDADTATKLSLYVAGINAYLAQLRADPKARLPGEYAQLPFPLTIADISDWTPQDTLALARLQQFQLSETLGKETDFGKFALTYGPGAPLQDPGKLHTWIRAAAPPTARTHTLTSVARPRARAAPVQVPALGAWGPALKAAASSLSALRAALRPLGELVGSNNWVVDAAHSANGRAMVANDPHLPLKYPPLFHLATLTSAAAGDNLNLSGGAFPGVPGALVGRGAHVGWGVTVVGFDVTDLYLEQFVDAGHVRFDPAPGAAVAVAVYPQTFHVRTAAGLLAANDVVKPVVIVPHHGPLVQAPDSNGKAVSVRWTGHESYTQDLKAFLGLATASSVDGAFVALKGYATGAQNFVLADDQGNIGFDPHALIPVRNFADARVVGTNVIPPWFPLPGNGPAEWGSGNAADNCAGSGSTIPAAACWIPDAQLPQGKNPAKGYFATANADPIGVSDDNNPLAHPPYLSFDWDDSTGFRHARIVKRLQDAIAASGKISLDDMQSIQADHVSNLGAVFTAYVAGMPSGSTDFEAARAMLAQWTTDLLDCPTGLLGIDPAASPPDPDAVHARDSAGCLLFHAFLRRLLNNVFADDLAVAGLGIDAVAAVKGMIYMLDPATPTGDQTFCNDVDAAGAVIRTHSCAEQVSIALLQAYGDLTAVLGPPPAGWRWGRFHTMQPVSQLALVTSGYQPGPFARPGGAFTVDVGSPSLSDKGLSFGYASGGNVRHISVMDPANPVIKMQLPGPERDGSAGIFTGGPDLLRDWVQNKYFDFAHGTQVAPLAVAAQTFNPP